MFPLRPKIMMPLALGLLSAAALWSTPVAYAAGEGGLSPGEFKRYQNQQELELEREQALRANLSKPESLEERQRERRRFEAERFRQRLLLERQRRRVAGERAGSRPRPRLGSSRGIILQQLHREQASERLSRKLLR